MLLVIQIQKYPFLLLLIPFSAGIIIGHFYPEIPEGKVLILTGSCWFLTRLPTIRHSYGIRFVSDIFLLLSFTATGLLAIRSAESSGRSFDSKQYPYAIAVAENRPVQKMRTLAVPAVIRVLIDSCGRPVRENERVMLYFAPSDEAYGLTEGRMFIIRNRLGRIKADKNPEAFDYAAYLQTQGIRYSQYLGPGQWKRLNKAYYTPGIRATKIRHTLTEVLRNTGLTPRQYALLSSLVLGNREILMPDLKESFRTAGLSHILAISGLHTGVVFFLLYWLFYPLRFIRLPRFHLILMLPVLWLYAFVTGLSPSAVRATVMITIVLCGRLLNRRNFTTNALAMAAFILLVRQPLYLFDAGFQLSFLSVAAILILVPPIKKIYWPENRILRYLYGIPVVTFAIQVAIAPVLLYYFHEFPVFSCMINIAIVPLLPLMLGGGFTLIFTGLFQLPDHYPKLLTGYLLDFTDRAAGYIASLPYASLRNVAISPETLFFYFAVIGGICFYCYTRRSFYLILTGAGLISGIFFSVYQFRQLRLPATIVVYNTGGPAAVNLIEGNRNYICSRDTFFLTGDLEGAAGGFWIKHRLLKPEILRDTTIGTLLSVKGPLIEFHGSRMLLIDSHPLPSPSVPVYVDYGIIGNGFQGHMTELIRSFTFGEFIITAGIHPQTSLRLQRECRRLHLNYYVTGERGARIVTLPVTENSEGSR